MEGGRGNHLGGDRGGVGDDLPGLGAGRDKGGARRWRVATTEGALPLRLLVEDVLGLRLGQCVPVGYGLDKRPTRSARGPGQSAVTRSARRCDGGICGVRVVPGVLGQDEPDTAVC
jgi:hypothetical protein